MIVLIALINSFRANRDSNLKLNIILNFILKILSTGISFFLVPMTIDYLNTEQYGIWITLLSMLSWVTFTDIGLGNGLRNKLTEALSLKDFKSAREYISTAYSALSVIVLFVYVALLIVVPQLNWQGVFNTATLDNSKLIQLIIVVSTFFLSNFILSLYNQLYYANQQASVTGIGQFLLNSISIINILILKKVSHGSIIFLSVSYGISILFPSVTLTLLFFRKHKELSPKLKYVKADKIKDILSLGVKFFIVQIAALVFLTTSNIMITQVSGPEAVTEYNVAYKLFSFITIAHTIIVTPLWSAYTEAYLKNDIAWIKKILRYLNLLLVPTAVMLLVLTTASQLLFKVWIGNKVFVPTSLVIAMAFYTFIVIWNNIYAYFLNGVNKIDVQMYISIFVCIINIPICIFLSRTMKMGTQGMVLGQIITSIPFAIVGPLQTYKIIKSRTEEIAQV